MAAPLGFKTFNTGDVLSAADTNGYLMQGVLVFADAAARSAAITSPQEGQTSYLKDTDVIQVYSGSSWVTKSGGSSPLTTKGDLYTYSTTDARLAVGTNGHTLVADSSEATGLKWAAPAAGGAFTLLSTTTFSGTSVNLTSISGSYKHLYLQWYGLTNATANGYLDIRLNNNTGSVYNCFRNGSGGATTFAQAENAATFLRSTADNLLRTDSNNAGNMFIYNYANSANRKLVDVQIGFVGPTNNNVHLTTCLFLSNTAITEVNFFLDNAASFSTGTVQLYGVN